MEHAAESRIVIEPPAGHLTDVQLTQYLDGVATPEARARIDAHLAECAECRDEIVQTTEILASLRRAAWRPRGAALWLPTLAAAALVFILVRPAPREEPPNAHREPPVTATILPRIVAPNGAVDSVPMLVWRSVPNADSYLARVFLADGSVLWEQTVTDTTALPRGVHFAPGVTYHLRVEARTGFNRTAPSELVGFTVTPPRRE